MPAVLPAVPMTMPENQETVAPQPQAMPAMPENQDTVQDDSEDAKEIEEQTVEDELDDNIEKRSADPTLGFSIHKPWGSYSFGLGRPYYHRRYYDRYYDYGYPYYW